MPFCREVDDGKPSEGKSQAGVFVKEDAGIVRPAMGQRVSHATQEFGGLAACLFLKPEPRYTAHGNGLPCCQRQITLKQLATISDDILQIEIT